MVSVKWARRLPTFEVVRSGFIPGGRDINWRCASDDLMYLHPVGSSPPLFGVMSLSHAESCDFSVLLVAEFELKRACSVQGWKGIFIYCQGMWNIRSLFCSNTWNWADIKLFWSFCYNFKDSFKNIYLNCGFSKDVEDIFLGAEVGCVKLGGFKVSLNSDAGITKPFHHQTFQLKFYQS